MKFPNRKVTFDVRYAYWPTKMDNGQWVWLEWYRLRYWTRNIPGCPTFVDKISIDKEKPNE